jgi:hypothetical protein
MSNSQTGNSNTPNKGNRTRKHEFQISIDQKERDFQVNITNKATILDKLAIIFSAAALLVSVIVAVYGVWQWNVANLGKINLVKVEYITFRNLSFEEIENKDWGYPISFQNNPADENYDPNVAAIKSKLIAIDTVNGIEFAGTHSLQLNSSKNELAKAGHLDTAKYCYEKIFQPIVSIKNTGQTSCQINSIIERSFLIDTTNFITKANSYIKDTQFVRKNFVLDAGQSYSSGIFAFKVPLTVPIPDIQFYYEVEYTTVNNETKVKKFFVKGGNSDFKIDSIE